MLFLQELYTAIETGNVEEVELILQMSKSQCEDLDDENGKYFNLNKRLRPMYDMTPLHLAVGLNSESIVKLLLSYGSNPNSLICSESVSPLHLSVLYDLDSMVKILLESGGDPTLLDGEQKSCFDLAVENNVTHLLDQLSIGDATKNCENDTETLRKATTSESTRLSTRILPDNPKVGSDIDSFYSCNSAQTKTSQSSETSENENESVTHSTSATSSKDIWLPGYSYLMTDDDTRCNNSTDADVSSSTTIVDEYCSSQTSTSLTISPTFVPTSPPVKVPTPEELRTLTEAVKNMGIRVPVTSSTFPVLTQRAENGQPKQEPPSVVNSSAPGSQSFSPELQASLLNLDLIYMWGNLKIDLIQSLTPTKRTGKSFYNYLLLDPKIIRRANFSGNHLKSDIITNGEKFEQFLNAIFYVGKGCGNRPIAHLVDAKIKLQHVRRKATTSEKLSKILQIWKTGQGVILHSMFHHSGEREANINEAAMIDAIGINCNQDLTNVKKGSYLGTGAQKWTQKIKNQFGAFLLYKCFCSFVVSDVKVFHPQDV